MDLSFTNDLLEEFFNEIESLKDENSDSAAAVISAKSLKKCVEVSAEYLTKLKLSVLDRSFKNPQEEITFFKEVKPKFSSLLLFYAAIQRIELSRPEGSNANIKSHYENELKTIADYFTEKKEIYAYYKSGDDYLDNVLFLRNKLLAPQWLCKVRIDHDERFSTAADYIFAKIQANLQIAQYLEKAIANIGDSLITHNDLEPFKWTGETINLLEVVYGWYYTGQINHGQASITTIVRKLEKVFSVQIGRPYRRLSEIKQRKRLSRTKFIDEMGNAIKRKLDEDDEFIPN